ncbi:MAG: transporter substrate-binding domain-containing protein, partial [Rhodospirillales bacterium]|nr:transporter substrate-binding domain-containing protein [Rhodospirillales bacterium]
MNGVSRRHLLAMAATATVAGAGMAHAADDVLARVKKAGVLKVGTETYFAPFDFLKDGKATGLNYDIFAGIAEALGVKLEWIDLPWEGVLPGLESGKFDMVAGPATITKARMERYRFSPPIAEATVALLKRADDKTINKPADIAGKVVASGKATAQLAQLQAFGATLKPAPTIREFPDFTTAYADMAAGRV